VEEKKQKITLLGLQFLGRMNVGTFDVKGFGPVTSQICCKYVNKSDFGLHIVHSENVVFAMTHFFWGGADFVTKSLRTTRNGSCAPN
jgi:hypothetical protein